MAGTQEVNKHVGHVHRAVVQLETAVSDPVLRNALDPTKDMPLIIEDPLRNTIEIPLKLVHTWEVWYNRTNHHSSRSVSPQHTNDMP